VHRLRLRPLTPTAAEADIDRLLAELA